MKFAVITHVDHIKSGDKYFAYAPYVLEMNIWLKYVEKVTIVSPLSKRIFTPIDLSYEHQEIEFKAIADFNLMGVKNSLWALVKMPLIFWEIGLAMKNADHIHLRCPGNMGLIACFVQVFFPNKTKTAKYAGNWDPKSKQPWTYRLQKWILNNTFLTRNMKVLVYGIWENQSENIKPFFTATYSDSEKETIEKTNIKHSVSFIFTGSLVKGKNPLYALKLVEKLFSKGYNVILDLYGEGPERQKIEKYIEVNKLKGNIFLHGNQDKERVKTAYQLSHFVILPSKSEGWPKTIAEGMFWGCVPVATKISCIPFMLNYGNRGILLQMNLEKDVKRIENLIMDEVSFESKSKFASDWSQNYTTEAFESEIKKLLKK